MKYQGGLRRWVASIIDVSLLWIVPGIITAIITAIAALIIKIISPANVKNVIPFAMVPFIILIFCFEIYNNVYLPYKTNGQSIGKRIMKIRIVTVDNSELTLTKLFIRELVLQVTMGFLGYFALIPILFTEKYQGIHDMAASTAVVESK